MTNIIVFGAGGRAGRAVLAEALGRGHQVTAVVREPAKYPQLAGTGAKVVAGDVTDPRVVAELSHRHDAAVSAVYDPATSAGEFFAAAATALAEGLAAAGVGRLVAVGMGTTLEVAPGVAMHDSPDFPAEYRDFSVGHAKEIDVFTASSLDWVVVAPPPVVLAEGPGTGAYRLGGREVMADADAFTYADLATALVDQAETAPAGSQTIESKLRSRTMVAVG
jgi:uncharacterized protein